MSNTAVKEEDLPQVPEVVLVNKPDTLEIAIERIMALEMALEDLSRAVEIAQFSGQFNLVDGFRTAADELLKSKIQIEQPEMGDFKVTIVTNEKEEDAKA